MNIDAYRDAAELAFRQHFPKLNTWLKRVTGATEEYSKLRRDLEDAKAELTKTRAQTLVDPLTGVANRRAFDHALPRMLNSAIHNKRYLAIAMIDSDRFKTVNDTHGHSFGDGLINHMAKNIQSVLRSTDLVARFGGDEFVVLMECDSPGTALSVIEGKRQLMAHRAFSGRTNSGDTISVNQTISCGVAFFDPIELLEKIRALNEQTADPVMRHDAIERMLKEEQKLTVNMADKALYKAKAIGRNCVTYYLPNGDTFYIDPDNKGHKLLRNDTHSVTVAASPSSQQAPESPATPCSLRRPCGAPVVAG